MIRFPAPLPGKAYRLVIPIVALALGACQDRLEVHHERAFVLGTLVEISATGVRAEPFRKAAGAAFREMRSLQDTLSPLDGGSELVRFNARGHRQWVALEGPLTELVPRALSVQRASDDAFNPHLGRLVTLWGFREPPFPDRPPPEGAIRGLLEAGASHPALALRREGSLEGRLEHPGAALDLGGIAKGFAVDRAVTTLLEHGIDNALVNAGGDMRALGRRGERPWRIGIRHPRREHRVIATVELRDGEALVTSGDYERSFRAEGKRFHHLLHPNTGRPARRAQQASVLGPRATETDAWSTALFVEGPEGLKTLGPGLPGLVIDAAGKAHANPAMRERLQWRSEGIPAP